MNSATAARMLLVLRCEVATMAENFGGLEAMADSLGLDLKPLFDTDPAQAPDHKETK